MNKFKHLLLTSVSTLLLTAMTIVLAGADVRAQTTVFATGLKAPHKIILTPRGNLIVAEAGEGPNTGRVSIVDRAGNRRTLLDGLPSGLAAPNNDPSGPSGLEIRGRTLGIAIGAGDVVRVGPRPATEVPNPEGPSSPILSSVLVVNFDVDIDDLTSGFTFTVADHFSLANGFNVVKKNVDGIGATVGLLTDFRDYIRDPVTIVRSSNPFGMVLADDTLYVADASMNSVVRVDINCGRTQTLVTFPQVPNPLFPGLGPPFIDAVPTSVRLHGDNLLVTFLTGFPFPANQARVQIVDRRTGANQPFITGLTSAIDVLPVGNQFFVLEFSTNQLARAPGRLRRFDSPAGPSVVIADNLITPTNMAYDLETGDIFVTEFGPGRIVRVDLP